VTRVDDDAWRQLESVHTGDLAVEAFEQWVYAQEGLRALLGPALALAIVVLAFASARPAESQFGRQRH
jgi:hypothetical protein